MQKLYSLLQIWLWRLNIGRSAAHSVPILPWCTRYSSASFPASKKRESVPMTALILEVQNGLIPFGSFHALLWMDTLSVSTTHLDGGQVGELRQWWDKGIALGVHVKTGCNPYMIARYHKGVRSSEALVSDTGRMWCTSQSKCLRLVPYAVLKAFYAKLDALWRVLRSSSHRHHRNRIAAGINEEWRSARHADWLKDPFPYSTWIFHPIHLTTSPTLP